MRFSYNEAGEVQTLNVDEWERTIVVSHALLEDHNRKWMEVWDGGDMVRFKTSDDERVYRRTGTTHYEGEPDTSEYEMVGFRCALPEGASHR